MKHLVAGLFVLLASAPAVAQSGASIEVLADGMHSDRGQLRCFLFDRQDGYPTRPATAVARSVVAIAADRTARCRFENVAPGTYALALHHDEDADGEMDTGIFGIPTEGTGASRDARGSMGPPSFRDAAFVHQERPTTLRIHVSYVF